MNKVTLKLKQDLAGEHKAVKDYGERIKQTAGTPASKKLREIQGEEKHHKSELKQLLMQRGMRQIPDMPKEDMSKRMPTMGFPKPRM